jgi:hypothetical protein
MISRLSLLPLSRVRRLVATPDATQLWSPMGGLQLLAGGSATLLLGLAAVACTWNNLQFR